MIVEEWAVLKPDIEAANLTHTLWKIITVFYPNINIAICGLGSTYDPLTNPCVWHVPTSKLGSLAIFVIDVDSVLGL